ncbi:MAG: hypothetical protein ACKV2U_21385 [Bryobacteraceae bacterium]
MRKVLLFSAMSMAALFGIDPAAREVKSVYILRMGSGLDQFLASELTKSGVYTVTTDPQKADAVFTDSLGEGFEKKFSDLYPPPAPPAPPPPKADEKKEEKSDSVMTVEPMQRLGNSSFGRGKGTIFLVERKSRNLLWSMNRQPKNSAPKELVGQARKIVDRLRKDLAPPAAK